MKYIKLQSPVPKPVDDPWHEFVYPTLNRVYLPVPGALPPVNFFEVVENRQSRRSFGQMTLEQLSSLLWYTCKIRTAHKLPNGFLWQHRPAPSAGGRHPIDVMVLRWQEKSWYPTLYDPISHTLNIIKCAAPQYLVQLVAASEEVLPVGEGTILWLIAQPGRTLSKYCHGESLIWRDAGALLSMFALVAEALGLNACPLGITGDPWISTMLEAGEDVIGCGGLLVGTRK